MDQQISLNGPCMLGSVVARPSSSLDFDGTGQMVSMKSGWVAVRLEQLGTFEPPTV